MVDIDLIRKRAADHERFHRWTYGGSAYDDRRALLVEVDRLGEYREMSATRIDILEAALWDARLLLKDGAYMAPELYLPALIATLKRVDIALCLVAA